MKGMTARVALLTLAAATAPLSGQTAPHQVVRVAEGVYAVLQPTGIDYAANGNTTIIINEHDVIVVDATLTPASAEAVIAEIRKLTDRPVRYLINTHWHDDHVIGNETYQRAFPGIDIIAHPATRSGVLSEVIPSLEKNRTAYPQVLADFDAQLASGKNADGSVMTDTQRANTERRANIYRRFIPQMERMVVVPPNITVSDELVLRRGAREIRISWLGRGNTQGDLIVHLPHERVIITGDLVVHPIPFSFGSFLEQWPHTLDRLMALGADVIVPGHGPVMRHTDHIRAVRDLVAALMQQTRELVRQGKTLEEVRAAVDLTQWRTKLTGGDPVLERSFQAVFFTPATERAYRQAHGEF